MVHCAYNTEDVENTRFQIWILPQSTDLTPGGGTREFPKQERSGQLVALASGYVQDTDALPIRTRSRVSGATLKAGQKIIYQFEHPGRYGYLVPATGDRKSTRLNSSHVAISYAVFCLKKKK